MLKSFDRLVMPLVRITTRKPNATALLFLATILAVILANTAFSDTYFEILKYPIHLEVGSFEIFSHHGHTMSLGQFVNDVLMVIFFLTVGLEIKQEMLVGELASLKKASLPIIAAIGGMAIPVLCFMLVTPSGPAAHGAAIPMATDIAFALAVLASLGKRVPTSLKIFLTALAVTDDIGGIIVIALFYGSDINLMMMGIGFGILAMMYLAGRMRVQSLLFYFVCTFFVWAFFLQSGIHTTIAGVLAAFTVPARPRVHTKNLRNEIRALFNILPSSKEAREAGNTLVLTHTQISVINSIRRKARSAISPMQLMEELLTPFVNYFVLPLFAFANAGITLGGISLESVFGLPLAIFVGLFLGKTVGVSLFTWLAVKLKLCKYPKGMNTKNLIALSVLGGIGFTVSLFIATLSYADPSHANLLNDAKLGIFVGSIVSGLVGYFALKLVLDKEESAVAEDSEDIFEEE